MKNRKYLLLILGVGSLLLFNSCSSAWHIQRALAKDPSLLDRDTIVINDSVRVVTERTEVDSIFMMSKDTVIIERNNLKITHWIHQDSIFIEGECDSIIKYEPFRVEVPVETIKYEQHGDFWKLATFGLGGLFLAGVIALIIWVVSKRQPTPINGSRPKINTD